MILTQLRNMKTWIQLTQVYSLNGYTYICFCRSSFAGRLTLNCLLFKEIRDLCNLGNKMKRFFINHFITF